LRPPRWQHRFLGAIVMMAKRQAQRIVDEGVEHASILLILVGPKHAPQVGIHPLAPAPDQTLNEALVKALRATDAWGYCYVNEAWITDVPVFERAGVARVKDLPRDDRDECVILTAGLKDTEPLIFEAAIEGAPVTGRKLGPWQSRALRGEAGEAGVVRTW
jgi:hypothetical protein